VFPADAGVIPNMELAREVIKGVPCGCRGDPVKSAFYTLNWKCSLRMQG